MLALALACLLAATATTAIVLREQRNTARHELAASESTVARLRLELRRAQADLVNARVLSERRRAVLGRARTVLAGVDPLLSSVDELKELTAEIQTGRDTFAGDAESLIDTTIVLVNYLVDTNSADVDTTYLNELVDKANGELDDVRDDSKRLAAVDGRYGAAARRFDTRATTLSGAVESLERQLTPLAKG